MDCSFSGTKAESLFHMYLKCHFALVFWTEISLLLFTSFNTLQILLLHSNAGNGSIDNIIRLVWKTNFVSLYKELKIFVELFEVNRNRKVEMPSKVFEEISMSIEN